MMGSSLSRRACGGYRALICLITRLINACSSTPRYSLTFLVTHGRTIFSIRQCSSKASQSRVTLNISSFLVGNFKYICLFFAMIYFCNNSMISCSRLLVTAIGAGVVVLIISKYVFKGLLIGCYYDLFIFNSILDFFHKFRKYFQYLQY